MKSQRKEEAPMKTLISSVVTLAAVLSLFSVRAFAGVAEEGGDKSEPAFVLYLPTTADDPAILPADHIQRLR